jgi:hypothetical protein
MRTYRVEWAPNTQLGSLYKGKIGHSSVLHRENTCEDEDGHPQSRGEAWDRTPWQPWKKPTLPAPWRLTSSLHNHKATHHSRLSCQRVALWYSSLGSAVNTFRVPLFVSLHRMSNSCFRWRGEDWAVVKDIDAVGDKEKLQNWTVRPQFSFSVCLSHLSASFLLWQYYCFMKLGSSHPHHTCTHTCGCPLRHTPTQICAYISKLIPAYKHTQMHIYTCTHICMCTHRHMHKCMHTCAHVYIYMHIQTPTNIHTQAHMHTRIASVTKQWYLTIYWDIPDVVKPQERPLQEQRNDLLANWPKIL